MNHPAEILIIDDDPVFVEATKTVLESRYRVITALDGDEGLKQARERKPDLILLDILMPGRDGFQVCKELKKNPALAAIPVVMLTSFAQHKGETDIPVDAGLELEAEEYLEKPLSPEALLERVRAMLGRRGSED